MRAVAEGNTLNLLGPTFMHLRISVCELPDMPLTTLWDAADDVSEAVKHAENLTMTLVEGVLI